MDLSRLSEWRELNGFTLAEISDLTGLSTSMISLVERGKRRLAPATKVTVARRLGVPIRDLFDVEEINEAAMAS
ncbi:MAG: Helix-turn-helix domain [Acidimicrobiaceae bacterium]|jgi:transcriptional regulator with XRE-family HTH domain